MADTTQVLAVTLPPPSPALRMHQAAAELRRLAEIAQRDIDTSDYWACYPPATRWRDGLVNGFGGVTSEFAAACSPGMALALADWLDETAARLVQTTHPEWQATVAANALAVTDEILAAGEGA
jgi:hypothetical protein